MIPIRDDAPRSSYPYFTLGLIVANVCIFLYQFGLYLMSPAEGDAFVQSFAAIPANVSSALIGRYPLDDGLLPVFSSMFLHGGWMHLIGNMWFLWIFGDNIEDELGHLYYLFFYLVCGLAASVAHFVTNPFSDVPTVGASGAISGVMGAYMIRFPWARVVTLIPVLIIFFTIELPAVVLLAYWFLIQFMSGAADFGTQGGGVAWWAHIGGFVAGAALVWTRPKRRRQVRRYLY